MTAHPEHNLQTKINQWVRECVPQPHFFTGIDRTKKASSGQHIREKARGLVSGTPDTLLIIPGLPSITIELKAPGNDPTDQQRDVGAVIAASGGRWGWCNSVTGYAGLLIGWGVALLPGAEDRAARFDAMLASAATKRKAKVTKPTWRPRKGTPRFIVGKRMQSRAAKAGIRL